MDMAKAIEILRRRKKGPVYYRGNVRSQDIIHRGIYLDILEYLGLKLIGRIPDMGVRVALNIGMIHS